MTLAGVIKTLKVCTAAVILNYWGKRGNKKTNKLFRAKE